MCNASPPPSIKVLLTTGLPIDVMAEFLDTKIAERLKEGMERNEEIAHVLQCHIRLLLRVSEEGS